LGKNEAQHSEYKGLKLGGGQAHDLSGIISKRDRHTHNTDKDNDPCTWQSSPPVSVDTPRKMIQKFSSKLKYGHESQLEAKFNF